ncbi:hypothetical protein P308_23540 [Pseudomonas piscis]|nr:hypothetical protein P308_23540 [Pseudomonas piscis]
MDSSVFDPTQLLLGATVAGASRLAQQVMTDTAVPGITAFAAHQLTQPALRGDYALAGRLLEQASGKVLDAGAMSKTRIVQQPQGNPQGETLGFGNTFRGCGNRG